MFEEINILNKSQLFQEISLYNCMQKISWFKNK